MLSSKNSLIGNSLFGKPVTPGRPFTPATTNGSRKYFGSIVGASINPVNLKSILENDNVSQTSKVTPRSAFKPVKRTGNTPPSRSSSQLQENKPISISKDIEGVQTETK